MHFGRRMTLISARACVYLLYNMYLRYCADLSVAHVLFGYPACETPPHTHLFFLFL